MFRALLASLLAAAALPAAAWPTKAVTFIVPYPPGGGTDVIARIYQEPLSKALGQPIVIENRRDAGAERAAGAAAVLDHDRLAERLRERLLVDARDDVGASAGRVGHDERNRLRRPGGGRQRGEGK